jgi:membrane dipeptidase
MIPIIDGHLDLAMNALSYDRDQTWPLDRLRAREADLPDRAERGTPVVCLPELRRAGVRLVVATLFARARADAAPAACLRRIDADNATPALAHAAAHGQLAYYRLLEAQGQVRILEDCAALDAFWAAPASGVIGCIILMEGADPVTDPAQVEHWRAVGVRAISLAHYGQSAYASGNGADGPVTPAGRELLRHMHAAGLALDLSHLCDASFRDALEMFPGPVLASHSNCRALAPNLRQFTDEQLRQIIARGGVIGVVLYNGMIVPEWKTGSTPRQNVSLTHLADHIDRICQLAGDARHAGLGSDLDGGFGVEATPHEIGSVADLAELAPILAARGYSAADLAAVFHGNWLSFWRTALPASPRPAQG